MRFFCSIFIYALSLNKRTVASGNTLGYFSRVLNIIEHTRTFLFALHFIFTSYYRCKLKFTTILLSLIITNSFRKHYYYADLPTGYQITQQRRPLAIGGYLDFLVIGSPTIPETYKKSARIVQLQLEQDSGKSLHDEEGGPNNKGRSLIDLNRCGAGLMEIVFQPDLFHGEEAAALVKELSIILKVCMIHFCVVILFHLFFIFLAVGLVQLQNGGRSSSRRC